MRSGIHRVGYEVVSNVEVGQRPIGGYQVGPEWRAERTVVACIVDGLAPGIVRLKLKSAAEALGERSGQAVVDRTADRRILVVLQNLRIRFTRCGDRKSVV